MTSQPETGTPARSLLPIPDEARRGHRSDYAISWHAIRRDVWARFESDPKCPTCRLTREATTERTQP